MRKKLRLLTKNWQNFIAFFVLLVMVFNACRDPGGNDFIVDNPVGQDTVDIKPIDPVYFYVDSDGNFTETDSGRTGFVADEDAYVVFYSDDIDSTADRVGFSFEDKTIVFFFEKNHYFPISMVLSDYENSYTGFFTSYDHVTQTYSLMFEQDGDEEIWSNISLSIDKLTQYKDDLELSPSQSLRMRNMYVATCLYDSIYKYIGSQDPLQSRNILKKIGNAVKSIVNNPVVNIVAGSVSVAVGAVSGIVSYIYPPSSVILMPVAYYATYYGLMGIYRGIELQSNNSSSGGSFNVIVTSVSLNKTTTSLVVGAAETLLPIFTPSNASNKTVSWSSSNTAVATVSSNGTVTGRSGGSAIITVTTQDGGKTANCTVTINKANGAAVSGIPTVNGSPTYNSITVNAVNNISSNGQTVQYAITTSASVTPTSGWQSGTTFTDLSPGTTYYVYARTAENNSYLAGTARRSAGITTNKANGAPVSGNPTVNGSPTHNSITVNAVSNNSGNGQTVQYAITTSASVTPTSGWQSGTMFTNLSSGTTYYVYARTAENNAYLAGTASRSVGITTLGQGSFSITFETIAEGAPIIGGTITIYINPANGSQTANLIVTNPNDYTVIEWYYGSILLNTTLTKQTALTLNATDTRYNTLGTHNLTLWVEKDGKPYSRIIPFEVN